MKRTTFGIILCSAVLAISAFFVGRTPETPTFTRRPAVVVSPIEVSTASTGSPVVAPEVAAVPAALESAPRGGEARPELALPPQADDQDKPFPGSRVDPKVILALHGDKPLDRNHPHMAAAIEVQERAMKQLMAHPAVVGTSVGLNDDGQVAIVILTKSDAADLPRTLETVPVVVWNSGLVFARNRIPQEASSAGASARGKGKPGGGGGPPALTPRSHWPRPVPIGVSTSLTTADTPGFITAGTLGCRVKIGTDLYALSNNHVYANEGSAQPGAPVLQPGTLDGGVPVTDQIGTLFSYSTLAFKTSSSSPVNVIDAAIAAIPLTSPLSVGNATPADGYGMPTTGTTSAAVTMTVSKYGRTTGPTTASVGGINTSVNVGYDGGTAYFEHQILINSRTFSDAGDSGSLIVQSAGKIPVGLLFAGGRTTTIANQIADVLSFFGCEIDGSN